MASISFDAYKALMNKDKAPKPVYPIVGVWPEPLYLRNKWWMYVCRLMPDMSLDWDRSNPPELYNNLQEALNIAEHRNWQLLKTISNLPLTLAQQQATTLKLKKELQKKKRLVDEEQLMLQEAQKRAKDIERPEINDLILPKKSEKFRKILHHQLCLMPYLTRVLVSEKHTQFILVRSEANEFQWSEPMAAKVGTARLACRATIAEGFNLDPEAHWGKTKATIRDLLLPKANKLLQLASVQRLLAEAKLKGQHVLVCNGYVFWYEEEGDIGWTIKQTDRTQEGKKGSTLWIEGTIESKNHGRLIVLPYIKENGDLVQGHTKNAPHDGPAKPRHPSQYVCLPFHVLKDDLMISLFGELSYE